MSSPKSIFLLLAAAAICASCKAKDPRIVISDVWGRPSPQSAANSAFYLTIQNNGSEPDSLVAAKAAGCAKTQLHESLLDENSVMSMRHIAEIPVLAGESVRLAVGGLHVMCIGRQGVLSAGSSVPITLTFANAGEIHVEAEINEP